LQLQLDYAPYNITIQPVGITFVNDSKCSDPIAESLFDFKSIVFQCKYTYLKNTDSQINIMVTKQTPVSPGQILLGFGTFPWCVGSFASILGSLNLSTAVRLGWRLSDWIHLGAREEYGSTRRIPASSSELSLTNSVTTLACTTHLTDSV
jgi:hypothetical protein